MNKRLKPQASRPYMPGYGILAANLGQGLLPWSWAVQRLSEARTYWLATTQADGMPHAMPIWGLWLDNRFWFSTGEHSKKARNLAKTPYCVIGIDLGDDAVCVEAQVALTKDPAVIKTFCDRYSAKYQEDISNFSEPVLVATPQVAFAFNAGSGQFQGSATRWTFELE